MDAHPDALSQETRQETGQAPQASAWWPLDCLRSLGRAATIAAGAPLNASSKQHPEHRGFRILTTEQDGAYLAQVTHWREEPLSPNGKLARNIGNARFGSHEEAAQYARFLIVSGTLQK
jgi:hypothetical protein